MSANPPERETCILSGRFNVTAPELASPITWFSGVTTSQAKIIEFIEIGGSAAIGHAFEPMSGAVIDSSHLFYNLLADEDSDGKADLTFVEAAFTSIPFLSWSEVAIGDPLMRITYGNGGPAWTKVSGDANNDGHINASDAVFLNDFFCKGGPAPDPLYNADTNGDCVVDSLDITRIID